MRGMFTEKNQCSMLIRVEENRIFNIYRIDAHMQKESTHKKLDLYLN